MKCKNEKHNWVAYCGDGKGVYCKVCRLRGHINKNKIVEENTYFSRYKP